MFMPNKKAAFLLLLAMSFQTVLRTIALKGYGFSYGFQRLRIFQYRLSTAIRICYVKKQQSLLLQNSIAYVCFVIVVTTCFGNTLK